MKQVLILTVAIIMAVTVMAQPAPKAPVVAPVPQDEVVITSQQVRGPIIRLTIQDTTGKARDGGRYYSETEYNKVVDANQRMGDYIKGVTVAGLRIIDPQLSAMLTDTGYVTIKKSLLVPVEGGNGKKANKKKGQ